MIRIAILVLLITSIRYTSLCQSKLDSTFQQVVKLKNSDVDSAESILKTIIPTNRKDSLAYNRIYASILDDKGDLNQAKIILSKNLQKCTPSDTLELAESTNNLGLIYNQLGTNDSAAYYLHESLFYRKLLGDSLEIASSLGNIGLMFSNNNDFEKAEEYLQKGLAIKLKIDAPKESLALSFLNLGLAIGNQNRNIEETNLYRKALKLFLEINDLKGASMVYNNMAWNYQHVFNIPDSAIILYRQAIELRKNLKNILGTAQSTTNLAELYIQLGKKEEAIALLKESEKLALESGSKRELYLVELNYSRFMESIGDHQEALSKHQLATSYKDSMINMETQSKIYNLQTKYETAEKEQEIANQQLELTEKESEIQAKRIQIGGLIGGLVILILFGFIFYNQYQAKQNQKLQLAILNEKERGFESVIQATEEERKRISKDLHDGIGQQLSALKMALTNIASNTSDEDQQEDLEMIIDQFSKSAEEVRQVSHQMMPRTLMDYGLVNAIEDLLQNSFKFSDIKYDFEHRLINERFDERIEISLYRVLQELINNIIKHSQASEISVQLIQNKGKLLLFVEDNGKGMNNDASNGHGLLNIKSRLDMVKGTVNYEPSPSSGTSATISIPV
ncbi:tetratricopeptide repeat-containing sensor histidine kinase [Marinoscillum pacificum]|uniref:tetratricopeptide repeat-containing sensor histidine kinase n=1 Tax=Marinoscillum pacificum TaxID=392723 RepID=UPI0021572FB4|nr:sensor histidine kinase [Marinoscillum pacificum]